MIALAKRGRTISTSSVLPKVFPTGTPSMNPEEVISLNERKFLQSFALDN